MENLKKKRKDIYRKKNNKIQIIKNHFVSITNKNDKCHTVLKILISASVGARTSSQKIPCLNNSVIVLPSGGIAASVFALIVPISTE